jgi:excisionase family DNA binding protein
LRTDSSAKTPLLVLYSFRELAAASEGVYEMNREHLGDLLEAVRGVRDAVVQMEEELLRALTAEERRDVAEGQHSDTQKDWFTITELGSWLRVSRTTVYKLLRERHIPAYRIGRATRVRRRDVERWLEDQVRIE